MKDSTAWEAGSLRDRLSSLPLLGALDESSLAALQAELEWLSLPGGATLFCEDQIADALYIVIAGSLGVTVRHKDGQDLLVARCQAGELVGEMGLLGGGRRSGTVVALRDSVLLRLGKSSFEKLLERHPRAMLSIVSQLVDRLRTAMRHAGAEAANRTLALVPLGQDADHQGFARDLTEQLASGGKRVMLLDFESSTHRAEWFDAAEAASDKVLYYADPARPAWTELCLRQADRVVLVASAGSPVGMPERPHDQPKDRRQPLDLVLLHDDNGDLRQVAEGWRKQLPIDLVCHVRRRNVGDLARLARILNGTAVGLVLGCGGARGFAHLGVVRALHEAGIPIDMIAGCSMGAIVGAGVALEWDQDEFRRRLRRAFVDSNPINDYTLPFLSLVRGDKVARRLEEHFGGIRIENMWRPYCCVSTNLTAGRLAVHRDGSLLDALRASVAIPGLLPPVMIDGEAHVDGGMMNGLPVDVMSSRCGAVLAVDVASDPLGLPFAGIDEKPSMWRFLRGVPPIVDLLVRAATVNSDALARTVRARASILFQPPLATVNLLDWQACDRAVDIGYRHAVEKLTQADPSIFRGPP
ncbi:MAG TPA: patatin-like phospholipase family protein [Xanthobacteraceae bacterium]|jgi:NTE family protein|nr:patatin-like phospholipase family protein [Xanthobacteraceae bacterium]